MSKSTLSLSFTLLYLSTTSTSLLPTPHLVTAYHMPSLLTFWECSSPSHPQRLHSCLWDTIEAALTWTIASQVFDRPPCAFLSLPYPWRERKVIFLTSVPVDNAQCGHRGPKEHQNPNGQMCKWVLMINSQTLWLLYTYLEGYRHCIKVNISQD